MNAAVARYRQPVLTLYGRPGCHLCEQALQVLQSLQEELEFEIRERDISEEDALLRAYFDRIPVIAVDGVELCEVFVDEDAVRSAVRRAEAWSRGR